MTPLLRCSLALFSLTSIALALPGGLDPKFGTAGKVITAINPSGGSDFAFCMALQSDGKIVVAGEYFNMARYLPDGNLDPSFGNGGKVIPGQIGSGASGIAVQPDGKIVVAGTGGGGNFIVARFLSNGAPDGGFGSQGIAFVSISQNAYATDVALLSDGRIVVTGASGYNEESNFVLARFSANGSPEGTFITDFDGADDTANAIAVQADGKIVVAGLARVNGNGDIGVVRYEANGTLDSSFGTGGKVTTPVGNSDDGGFAVRVQNDGKIVVAGRAYRPNVYDIAMVRYNSDGSLDTGFGTGGKVTTPMASFDDSMANDLVIQSDGKIVVVGTVDAPNQPDIVVLRYHANGALDLSFGGAGKVITSLGGSDDVPRGVAIQGDGKIVVAGYTYQSLTGYDIAVVRYLGDGPGGGTFTVTPPSPAPAGSTLTATFSGWTSPNQPITYEVWSNNSVLVPAGSDSTPEFTRPPGVYVLKGRVYDSAGNFTDTADVSFRVADPPVATTLTATEVMTYSAKLNSSVDPNSVSTQLSWLYGTTTPPTNETPAQTVIGANPLPRSYVLSGLQPATTYYFQAKAVNTISQSLGEIISFTTASADPVHTVLHVTGENASSTGTEGLPEDAVWVSFGVPSLLGAGESSGFDATVRTSTGRVQSILSGPLDAPTSRVKSGDPVTDPNGVTIGGLAFKAFKSPVFADVEHWAVLATVAGSGVNARNDCGIWAGEPGGGIFQVAREGNVAPGTFGATFKTLVSVLRHDPGWLAFTAKLTGPDVNPANDCGLWTWSRSTGTVLHTRTGANSLVVLDGVPVKRIETLQIVSGSPGHGRHDSEFFSGLVTGADGQQVIVNFDQQQVQNHVRTGTSLPGGGAVERFGMPCWLPGGDSYSVLASLVPDRVFPKQKGKQAILRDGFAIAQRDASVADISNATFRKLNDPVADFGWDGEPYVAFTATVGGKGVNASNNCAVFGVSGDSETPKLIAREGSEPPGAPGTVWKRFTSLSVLPGRGALFTAAIAHGETQRIGNGLWAEDSSGALQLLYRTGDSVGGKAVKTFTVLSAVPGSPGQRRASIQGPQIIRPASVISRVLYMDGSSAVITTSVP